MGSPRGLPNPCFGVEILMANLLYVIGDATEPQGEGRKIILHCCNHLGIWGAGFVMALSRKWSRPEVEYKRWAKQEGSLKLGALQVVPVETNLCVANLIGQEGVGRDSGGNPPIRYAAIRTGLQLLRQYHGTKGPFSVHAPRLGAGLAGASWAKIEPLLLVHLVQQGIPVTIYDLPGSSFNP